MIASLLIVVAVAPGMTGGSRASAAGPPAARLAIDAGAAGSFIPGRPVPVRVQVDSDRFVRGELLVAAGTARLTQAVEVAGGSTKQFELTLPTVPGQSQLQVQVSLTEQRTRLATIGAPLNAAPDVEVVGLLPAVLAGQPVPGSVPLAVEAGTARFVGVSPQDLALAPASLGPLSVVALGPDDLGRLGAPVRDALLAWTAAGGRLMIDSRPGESIPGLPAGWLPDSSRPVTAGRGEVVLSGGAMAAGRWSGLIRPASHSTDVSQASSFMSTAPLSNSLASDAGLSTPKLPWLIGFLLLYIAVVGPLSFLVLRRIGHADLLWVVIPVVALVFAATGYLVGAKARSGVKIVHATMVDTTAGGGTAVSYVAVVSRREATTVVGSPAGWVLQRYVDPNGNSGPFAGAGGFTAAMVNDGVEGRLKLSAGQFAMVQGNGAAHLPGQLTVTAQSARDGHAAGTVTNNMPWPLQDVSVLIGTAGTDVGTLAPGAKADWTIADDGSATNGGNPVELLLWGPSPENSGGGIFVRGQPGFVGPGGARGADKRPVSLSVWQAAPGGLAPGSRGSGVAVAVGWTDQYKPALSIGGHHPVDHGRTAIVGTSPVGTGSTVGDLSIRRNVLRGNLMQVGPGMFADTANTGQPAMFGWSLPKSAAGHGLALSVPAGSGRVEVWGSRGWRTLLEATDEGSAVPGKPGFVAPLITPPAQAPAGEPGRSQPQPATQATPPATLVLPTPVPFPVPGPNGFGPATHVTLAAGDVHDDAVYVRLGGAGSGRPFDLNAFGLKVQP